jgi:biopolymer transport protein ExbD
MEPSIVISSPAGESSEKSGASTLGRPRRRFHHAERKLEVSLNSLLDVLSVLLVFLMKSYSTSAVQIKPSHDLQVPLTASVTPVVDSTAVTITAKGILVDDRPVMELEEGRPRASDVSAGGLLLEPLFAKLREEAGRQKRLAARNSEAPFKGIVTIIADRLVPFPMVEKVMYTAGQADFSTFKLALIKSDNG